MSLKPIKCLARVGHVRIGLSSLDVKHTLLSLSLSLVYLKYFYNQNDKYYPVRIRLISLDVKPSLSLSLYIWLTNPFWNYMNNLESSRNMWTVSQKYTFLSVNVKLFYIFLFIYFLFFKYIYAKSYQIYLCIIKL